MLCRIIQQEFQGRPGCPMKRTHALKALVHSPPPIVFVAVQLFSSGRVPSGSIAPAANCWAPLGFLPPVTLYLQCHASPRSSTQIAVAPPSAIQRHVVELYEGSCQVCAYTPRRRSGLAAVPWHIRPLHRPHAGSDSLPNLLCVCPTHAQELDAGAVRVGADGVVSVAPWRLRLEHQLDPEALRYRWERNRAAVT
jgi:hypothetical protein